MFWIANLTKPVEPKLYTVTYFVLDFKPQQTDRTSSLTTDLSFPLIRMLYGVMLSFNCV